MILSSLLSLIASSANADDVFKPKLEGTFSNTLSSGLNQYQKNIYNDLSISGSYSWDENIRSSATLGLVKSFTQEAKLLFKDIILETALPNLYTHHQTQIRLRGYLRTFLPASQASRDQSEIIALKIGSDLNKDYLNWNFGYEFSLSSFIHKYITARDGSGNPHYGMTHSLTIGYQVHETLSIATSGSLLNFATYNKTPRATYSFVQELDFSLSPNASLFAGLSTGGRQYKNNGKELNLSLFNAEGSEIFLGANYVF